MTKAESKATIMVADGGGRMVQVQDHRFEAPRDWPIRFEVPKEQAETWLAYFYAECTKRGWSRSGISQLEAGENSGSTTVETGGVDKPKLAVVWERKRGKGMQVRARSAEVAEFPVGEAQELFDLVSTQCRSGALE